MAGRWVSIVPDLGSSGCESVLRVVVRAPAQSLAARCVSILVPWVTAVPRAHGYKNLISLQQDPRELDLNPPKPALRSGEQSQPRGSAARDPDFPCIWGNCSAALSGEGLGERQQDREPGSSTRPAIKAANLFTQADKHCTAGTVIALRSPGRVVPTRARPPPSPG